MGWETVGIMRILASNPDTIGDLVLRQPLYEALSKSGSELMLIVRSNAASVARLVAPAAQIIYLDQDPYSPRFAANGGDLDSVFEAVRRFQPDRLLVAPYQWTMFEERLAENLPDAGVVGMNGGLFLPESRPQPGCESRLAFDRRIEVSEQLPELRKNELLCSAILGRQVDLPNPVLQLTPAQIQAGEARLGQMGITPGEFWVAMVGDTALSAARNWGADCWGQVLGQWASRHDRSFVFIGDISERPTTESVQAAMGESAGRGVFAMGEDVDSDTMLGLIHLSRGYVGRASWSMHVAAAFGKPVIAVCGGETWPRFIPACERGLVITVEVPCAGCKGICPFAEAYCVKRVPIEEVMKAVDLLESGRLESKQVRVLRLDQTLASRMVAEAARVGREHARRLSILERQSASQLEQREAELRGKLEQRESKLRSKLAETFGQVTLAESGLVDARIEMARLRADQAVAMKCLDQKSHENTQLMGEVMQLREENAHLHSRVGQLSEQDARLREQHDELQEREARFQGLAAASQQYVRDLQSSRWRRLGLRIGIAKKAAWEQENGDG